MLPIVMNGLWQTLNRKIYSSHEQALRIMYHNRKLLYQELLRKDNPVSIHHRNVQSLATEMFKVYNNSAQVNSKKIFTLRRTINLEKGFVIIFVSKIFNIYVS